MGVGEPAYALYGNVERAGASDGGEGLFQFVETGLGPIADELRGDVQVAQRTPSDGCLWLEELEEEFQIPSDLPGDIEADEESHW